MIVTSSIFYSSPTITTSYFRPREKPSSGIIGLGLTTLLLCFQLALGGFLFSGGWNKTAILKNTQQEIITHRQVRTFPKSVERQTKFDAKTLKDTVCCSSQYVPYAEQRRLAGILILSTSTSNMYWIQQFNALSRWRSHYNAVVITFHKLLSRFFNPDVVLTSSTGLSLRRLRDIKWMYQLSAFSRLKLDLY